MPGGFLGGVWRNPMRQTRSRRADRRGGGAKPPADRANLYDEVTGRIISELEAGRFPWVQPWGRRAGDDSGTAPGLTRNATTGRSYNGVHILIHWAEVIERGSRTQAWLTFLQTSGGGGN